MARKKERGGIALADIARGVFMLATAAKLKTRREVEAGLREALPGASVLSVETGARSKGCKYKIFTIAYRDIQFTCESYQSGNFFFAGKSAMSHDDYCKQLFQHFSGEIGEIGERYGVRIDGGCGISICNDVAAMEDQTTAYQIGPNRFQVQRGRNSLTFRKNGQKLPIRYYHERSGTHTGAEYFYWVTVEDFAMLMGMSVDRVEPEGVYLRLP